ncbi:MAG: lipoprotein [Roseiarcus sp.]
MIPAPTRNNAARVAALLLIVGLALGASGCGRRGPLEAPPNASAVATPAPTPSPSPTAASSDDPTASMTHHKEAPITPPKTPFVLDPLL